MLKRRGLFGTILAAITSSATVARADFELAPDKPQRNYPVTMAELKSMIDAEWPAIAYSEMAVEKVAQDGPNIRVIGHEEVDIDGTWIVHKSFIAGVSKDAANLERDRIVIEGTFFNEEQVARAMWAAYRRHMPANDFTIDSYGKLVVWRIDPEFAMQNGICKGYMRLSGVWLDRSGNLQTLARSVPC